MPVRARRSRPDPSSHGGSPGRRPQPGRDGPGRPPRRRPRWAITRPGDPGRRLVVLLLAIAFILTLFGGRLVQLQGMDAASFRELAKAEQMTKTDLPGVRGNIFDDTGQPLAMTLQTITVTADPVQMHPADMPQYAAGAGRAARPH